jgi:hypothetical protein
MREPFLITAFALMLDGYARRVHQANPHGIYLVALGFITALFISPPFSFLLLGGVSLAWLWEGKGDRKRTGWILGVIAALGLAALALTIRSWAALEGRPGGNVVELVGWWLTSGAKYQLHVLAQRSGWVQKMFELAPEWSHMPLATLYGLVQPFLPAAVMDSTSLPLIRTVVSLRGLGWFVFLPFLMYAPFASLRQEGWRSLPAYLTLFVWGGAVLVSYRDAGQQWDNPRWRAVFLCAQVAMVGWAWVAARQSGSPWLGRVSVLVVFATLAFVHWEAGRYYQTPRLNLWKTLSLIGAFSILFLAASIGFDRYRKTKVRT